MRTVDAIKSKADIEAMKERLSPLFRLMFVIGINSGLRISDILGLSMKDLLQNEIRIVEKKTKKARAFPINEAVRKEVALFCDKYWDKELTKPLFDYCRQHIWRVLATAGLEAGIEAKIGTHTLRKTFGYHLYKSGTNLQMIQTILNHRSEKDTLRYIGITREDINERINGLNL
jgi:integrase